MSKCFSKPPPLPAKQAPTFAPSSADDPFEDSFDFSSDRHPNVVEPPRTVEPPKVAPKFEPPKPFKLPEAPKEKVTAGPPLPKKEKDFRKSRSHELLPGNNTE